MKENEAHTPLPWRVEGYQIFGADGQFVGSTFNRRDDAFIVQCVNNYTALLGLLADTTRIIEDMRDENKLHGHITDANANYLHHVKPRIDIALAEKDQPGTVAT